jgi:hypothetical protein
MTKLCEKCGAAPGVMSLATGNAAPDAPGFWACAACFGAGVHAAWVQQQAEEDAAEHRDQGGRLNYFPAQNWMILAFAQNRLGCGKVQGRTEFELTQGAAADSFL